MVIKNDQILSIQLPNYILIKIINNLCENFRGNRKNRIPNEYTTEISKNVGLVCKHWYNSILPKLNLKLYLKDGKKHGGFRGRVHFSISSPPEKSNFNDIPVDSLLSITDLLYHEGFFGDYLSILPNLKLLEFEFHTEQKYISEKVVEQLKLLNDKSKLENLKLRIKPSQIPQIDFKILSDYISNGEFQNLRKLNLKSVRKIEILEFESIGNITTLEKLRVCGLTSPIIDSICKFIKSNQNVTSLKLETTEGLDDILDFGTVLEAIGRSKTLLSVTLGRVKFNALDLIGLLNNNSTLKFLKLTTVEFFKGEFYNSHPIPSIYNSTLEYLYMHDLRYQSEHVYLYALWKSPSSLRNIAFTHGDEQPFEAIQENHTKYLKTIHFKLFFNKVVSNFDCLKRIVESDLPTLTHIYLTTNSNHTTQDYRTEYLELFFESIHNYNTHLEYLNLSTLIQSKSVVKFFKYNHPTVKNFDCSSLVDWELEDITNALCNHNNYISAISLGTTNTNKVTIPIFQKCLELILNKKSINSISIPSPDRQDKSKIDYTPTYEIMKLNQWHIFELQMENSPGLDLKIYKRKLMISDFKRVELFKN